MQHFREDEVGRWITKLAPAGFTYMQLAAARKTLLEHCIGEWANNPRYIPSEEVVGTHIRQAQRNA